MQFLYQGCKHRLLGYLFDEIVSAILLSERMVKNTIVPGNTTSHHASNCSRAPANKDPHVTISTGTPKPKKESEDSVRIADAVQATKATEITGKAFGKACLNMMRQAGAPLDFAEAM